MDRFAELKSFLQWTSEDARRVQSIGPLVEPHLAELAEDFFRGVNEIEATRRVITGGPAQIERLKITLANWIRQLVTGPYDDTYVESRWKVGYRHVEIGLEQIYTIAALARLRNNLSRVIQDSWPVGLDERDATIRSLNKLLDFDLAIIEDAYHCEFGTRLQNAGRLATLGQVAGGVAHELRNPLNVIRTSVFYLQNAKRLTAEKTQEHLARMERNVTIADRVIAALSSFARMPRPTLRAVSVRRLVEEALDTEGPSETIDLHLHVPGDLPDVLADPEQMRIALANLIRNACDAMPDGGRLEILARVEDGRVAVSVIDRGEGIPPGDLSRILEPLYSTKPRGLGLGLAITQSIVEKNAGALRVQSKLGGGSTFTIELTSAPSGGEARSES